MKKQFLGVMSVCVGLLFGCQVGQEVEEKPQAEFIDSLWEVDEQEQELDESILFGAIKKAIKDGRSFEVFADTNTWEIKQEDGKYIVNGQFVVNGDLSVFEAHSDINNPYEPTIKYIHDEDFFSSGDSSQASSDGTNGSGNSSNYSQTRPSTVNEEFDFDKAVANIKTEIKAQLKDPSSFKAKAWEWNVYQNDVRWVVRGTFSANNSFGARTTHSFEASFSKTGDQNKVLLLTIE